MLKSSWRLFILLLETNLIEHVDSLTTAVCVQEGHLILDGPRLSKARTRLKQSV
jgi:hypothetical protein